MIALEARELTVRRGGRIVLDTVSATFSAGQLTAVIGPNGAGKSSLLAALAGLVAPESGQVTFDGLPLAGMPRRLLATRRAYLPQAPQVEWPISVERLVMLGLTPVLPAFGGVPAALLDEVDQVLAAYDLEALRHRPATSLSGGERARAMLARAVVGDPEVLIVDEPTAGLDPRHAIDAARRLRARADTGRTVVVAIHDLDLAVRCADRVVALKDGRLVIDAAVAEGLAEGPLSRLYDLPARVRSDEDGTTIRFGG